jgi:wobble nucleotide-excising tRNase
VSNAQLALEKINAHRAEQEKAQMEEGTKAYFTALDTIGKKIAEHSPVFRRVEGNDEWNKQLDEAEQFAKQLHVQSPDPNIRAGIAWRAALSPMLLNQVTKLYSELKETQAQLSKYTTAKPKAGGGASPADAVGGGKPQYDDFLDALKGELRF